MRIKEELSKYIKKEKDSPTTPKYTDFLSFQYPDILPQPLALETLSSAYSPENEIEKLNYVYKTGTYKVDGNLDLAGNFIAELYLDESNSKRSIILRSKDFSDLVISGNLRNSSLTINLFGRINFLSLPLNLQGESEININSLYSDVSVVILRGMAKNSKFRVNINALCKNHVDINFVMEHSKSYSDVIMRGVNLGGRLILRGNPVLNDYSYSNLDIQILNISGQSYGIPELTINSNTSSGNHSLSIKNIKQSWIEYLRARGLNEKNAQNLIVDSFLFNYIQK